MKRTGLQTFARMVIGFCRFFYRYKNSLIVAVNALPIASADKSALVAAIDAIDGACAIARAILIRLEH